MKKKLVNPLNPFRITFSGFINLSEAERDVVFDEASKKNMPFCEKFFKNKKNNHIEWFVIAHKKGNVILKGGCHNEPLSEELDILANKIDKPVFTYTRPIDLLHGE